ncbi:Potassium-transporting ATPase A chain [Marinomonas spartinae]|uniref:Potassium-transporting ATPase A chain n=1 Tax=Marinomonas spartinae TaxID=1792290 RepID=A0A1A8TN76_9GAMM|nr:potassium-transporting ATPase subunit KdpA [Marinomonas spartinae]SBS34639.1 Potassium-transporting ATPase A chain [Marinomonas spartinae]
MFEIVLICLIAVALAIPLGSYMAGVFSGQKHITDGFFSPIESLLYRLMRVSPNESMTWRTYGMAFLMSNLILGVVAFLLLKFQQVLPFNPDHIGPLSWDLALHTAISFITNTNQQHYAGQAQLSYLSQGFLIVTLQFVSPAMGLAICVAVLRGMTGGKNNKTAKEGEERDLGNYYVDVVRGVVRVFLPLSLIVALLLAWQGVPSTFSGAQHVQPLDTQSSMSSQAIPVGPVSAMAAIKQLGTNGGGWYGSNSADPLENPTPLSDVIETIAIVLIPIAVVFMAGGLIGRKKFAWMSFATMAILSVSFTAATIYSENQANAAFVGASAMGPNMEGKEVRFGPELSALWGALTTQTSNGSVNASMDSFNPLGGLMARSGMLVNAIWGGVGCGFVNFIVYVWLAVFLSGLMIGRTPEIFGRKIETKEVTPLSSLIVLPALCILGLLPLPCLSQVLRGTVIQDFMESHRFFMSMPQRLRIMVLAWQG